MSVVTLFPVAGISFPMPVNCISTAGTAAGAAVGDVGAAVVLPAVGAAVVLPVVGAAVGLPVVGATVGIMISAHVEVATKPCSGVGVHSFSVTSIVSSIGVVTAPP